MSAFGHIVRGDVTLALEESEKSIGVAVDPFYSQFGKWTLGMTYFIAGQIHKAEESLKSLSDFSNNRGVGVFSLMSQLLLSTIVITKGNLRQGFKRFEKTQEALLNNHMKIWYVKSNSIIGGVYTRFLTGPSPSLATMVKNVGFLAKNVPFADRKAGEHFDKAVKIYRELGAKGDLGQALLGLGRLHKAKKRNDKARECFSEAADLFLGCDAHIYLKQAKEELASV
jgi:tetratricopeptide (TPR) repeat protein